MTTHLHLHIAGPRRNDISTTAYKTFNRNNKTCRPDFIC
jgi:hypothetical protein